MKQLFESLNPNVPPTLDADLLDDILAEGGRTASELIMLYFASLAANPDADASDDIADRIIQAISDLADDGDEDAMMSRVALTALDSAGAPDEARIVGVAMMQAVVSRPILQDVISGDVDYEDAAASLSVIKIFSDSLLQDVFPPDGLDDLDDVDLDDIDFGELASQLGLSEAELDLYGDSNDR